MHRDHTLAEGGDLCGYCTILDGATLDVVWTKPLPKGELNIIVMEGIPEYVTQRTVPLS